MSNDINNVNSSVLRTVNPQEDNTRGDRRTYIGMMTRNRYKNPWFKSCNTPRPEFYENDAPKVREYRGVEIYKLFDRGYDFVLSGTCITQRAGITEYQKTIDEILGGRTPVDTVVCKHLRSLGFKALSYAEYSANWRKIDALNEKLDAA